MGADKSPLEILLDLTVYAPLGLAVTARERLPDLIERGRQYAGTQLNSARIAGQPAGDDEAVSHNGQPSPPPPTRAEVAPATDEAETPAAPAAESTSAETVPAPSGAHLAIPGYDTLSASQVVQRLAGLAADELEAVRAYESDTRGRRTILSKISQLQTAS